jgi:hypothetical protein
MKLITSELEIKNKNIIIKYGIIFFGISLLLVIIAVAIGGILNPNIPTFFKGMIALPFPVFLSSWILMIISYQIQIISHSDFSRRFKSKAEPKAETKIEQLTNRNNNAVFTWFGTQVFLGFFGHIFYFGFDSPVNKIDNFDLLAIFLFSISPTILFIISSYFARLNRIENKIDILLKEKEENQND